MGTRAPEQDRKAVSFLLMEHHCAPRRRVGRKPSNSAIGTSSGERPGEVCFKEQPALDAYELAGPRSDAREVSEAERYGGGGGDMVEMIGTLDPLLQRQRVDVYVVDSTIGQIGSRARIEEC